MCGSIACIFATEKILEKLDECESNAKRKQKHSNRLESDLVGESSQKINKQKSGDAQDKHKDDNSDNDEGDVVDEDVEEDEEDTK